MMSCGVPIITTNVMGISNVVSHKKDAIVVGISTEEIKAGVKLVLHDEELKDFIGKNARTKILDKYSFEKILELEKNHYKN